MKRSVTRRSILASAGLGFVGVGTASGASKTGISSSRIRQVNDNEDVRWNRYHGGDGSTRFTHADVTSQNGLKVDWETQFGESPTVLYKENELLVTNNDGTIFLVDSKSGSQEIIHSPDDWPWQGLWVEDIYFFSGFTDEIIGRVDLSEGGTDWQRTLSSSVGIPLLTGETLYYGRTEGGVLAVDPETGETIDIIDNPINQDAWSTFLTSDGEETCFASSGQNGVYAFDTSSRSIKWTTSGIPGRPVCDSVGIITYARSTGGVRASAIDPDTGDVNWENEYSNVSTESSFRWTLGPQRFFLATDEQVLAINRADGRVNWRLDNRADSMGGAGNQIYIGVSSNSSYSIIELDREDGTERWRMDDLSIDRVPAFGDGRMYVPHDGSIHALVASDDDPPSNRAIAAEITDVTVPVEEVTTRDTVTSLISVENTGSTEHTFFVGYSVRAPDGTLYDNDATTGQPVTLQPGAATTVNVEWDASSEVPGGEYDVITAVWEEADRTALETQLAVETIERAFDLDSVGLPTGSSVLPPTTPSRFPYSNVQELAFENLGEDRSGVEGDGIRFSVDRAHPSDDELTLSVSLDTPEDSLIGEIYGHRRSQLLVLYDESRMTLDGLRSQVDGGTPEAVRVTDAVADLASLASLGTAGSLGGLVQEAVTAVAEEVGIDWATSQLTFETPPRIDEEGDLKTVQIDFSTETVPMASSPATIEEYSLEGTFTDLNRSDSPPIIVLADMRGMTDPIYTPADGDLAGLTGASLQTHEYPVEYRHQVNVPTDINADGAGGSERDDRSEEDNLGDLDELVDDEIPGLGPVSALAGIGGASYWLANREGGSETDQD